MHLRYGVSQITLETIADLIGNPIPILIACIRKDQKFQDQLITLDYIADHFRGSLAVYYSLEDVFPYFSERYSIKGTPTFLVLDQGNIMGNILGITPYHDLIEQINNILLEHAYHTKTAGADHLCYVNDLPDSIKEKSRVMTPAKGVQRKLVVE
jgi:hypothetical protein